MEADLQADHNMEDEIEDYIPEVKSELFLEADEEAEGARQNANRNGNNKHISLDEYARIHNIRDGKNRSGSSRGRGRLGRPSFGRSFRDGVSKFGEGTLVVSGMPGSLSPTPNFSRRPGFSGPPPKFGKDDDNKIPYYEDLDVPNNFELSRANGDSRDIMQLLKQKTTVTFKMLSDSVTAEDIEELCVVFGDVITCRLITDRNVPSGVAVADFLDRAAADRVVRSCNGKMFHGRLLECYIHEDGGRGGFSARPCSAMTVSSSPSPPLNGLGMRRGGAFGGNARDSPRNWSRGHEDQERGSGRNSQDGLRRPFGVDKKKYGRGGVQKPKVTREELDIELEVYRAGKPAPEKDPRLA